MKYLDVSTVRCVQLTPPPIQHKVNAQGYSTAFRMPWKLRIGSRWYRLYLSQTSNAGTLYVRLGGEFTVVDAFYVESLTKLVVAR